MWNKASFAVDKDRTPFTLGAVEEFAIVYLLVSQQTTEAHKWETVGPILSQPFSARANGERQW